MDRDNDWLDPEIAWRDLHEAVAEGNIDDMEASASELLDWLNQGGRPPHAAADLPLQEDWNRVVTWTVCTFTRRAAARARAAQRRVSDTKGSRTCT